MNVKGLWAPPRPIRITLIHAIADAVIPIREALREGWPECLGFDLLDSSLAPDVAAEGGTVTTAMVRRFCTLAEYAASSGPHDERADAILFTCSAFGPAIDAARRRVKIPVLKPNEAAFEEAFAAGPRIGLVVTFPPSLPPMLDELHALHGNPDGHPLDVQTHVVPYAFAAMKVGNFTEHNRLLVEAVAAMPPLDAIVLG
ncbi:MAG: arylsulfatase [Betaproteobacteria bacterium]|nr:arylsulfatase [Betaproteobacteria bacterium]